MGNTDRPEMTTSMHGSMSLDGDVEKLQSFYNDWAESYDADVASHDYGLPSMMVQCVEAALRALEPGADQLDRSVRIVDAGCGTGLVGQALADAGFTNLHGIDLSFDMVEKAKELGVYQSLEGGIDLSSVTPDQLLASADVVTVGGVFTVGHVAPSALHAMAPIVRHGGALVVSTRQAYLEETDFSDVVDAMMTTGAVELLLHAPDAPYTMDSNGDYWAFKVT